MADITLARPQAGQHPVLESVPDSRLVLQFPADQATMERSGDNLTFTFDDGSSIELTNFYTQYSQESMPEFVVDGVLVAGADFFNAFGPDLMPAAGPGAATRAARYNEFGSSDLHDGITHLDGLDYRLAFGAQATEDVNALGTVGGTGGLLGGIGGQGNQPGIEGDSEVPPPPPPAPAQMGSAEAFLNESAFTSGGNTTSGDIDVTLDGAGTVSVGEIVFDVPAGPFSQQASISTENGVLNVTLSRDADGNLALHYDYAANPEGVEHDKNTAHDELVGDNFKLTVSDGVSSAEGSLDVTIKDGTPTLTVNGGEHAESSVVSGGDTAATAEGSFAFDFGPDNREGKSFTVSVGDRKYDISDIKEAGSSEIKGEFGTLTIKADGSYTYKADPDVRGNAQDSFVLTITDADGDSRDVKLDVTVTPAATIAHVSVNEAGLADAQNTSETAAIRPPEGYTIVGVKQDGQYGTVSQDPASGEWHYVLDEAIDSGTAQGANTVIGADSVKLIVEDGHGNTFEVDVPVDIIDDVPSLDLNHASAVQEANGDHFQASFDFDFGADTKHGDQSASVSVTVDGETVKDGVTVTPDGTVIYEQSNEAVHTEFGAQGQAHDVTVTVTDADGDTTSQSVHLETVGVQGQVVHAGLSSSQWPKLPDYNGPKDPFDKDAFNAAKNSYEAEHGNGSFPYADTIAYYNAYAQAYILAHTQSYDKLLELIPGLEVNSAGFAGDGLNPDILDHFDNTQSSDILHDADDLHAALDPGQMIPPVFAGQDSLYGGAGNDMIFGDHVSFITDDSTLDGMDALRAAVQAHAAANGFAIGGGDAGIHQYILDHPEVVGSLNDPSSAADQNDLIVGGAGNDVLAGQGGHDVLLGDGDQAQTHGGSLDAVNTLLGQYAHGSNPAAGVHDLMEHGSPQEIRDFVDGIEGSGVENAQDGNDYLFGGSGDDVLFGQGGDDQLFGGDGSDALFGGSGDDYLDGGNDAAADHLYGGSGNDLIVYHPNDVIDGGSGMDVLLVGNNEDMDRLFRNGSLDADVSNVEMIVSGDINNLTNLDALKDIGITVNENRIDFGDGWQSTDSAHDGFNAWTNGTVTVEVGSDVQVSAQDSLQQQAEVAAQKICADNG